LRVDATRHGKCINSAEVECETVLARPAVKQKAFTIKNWASRHIKTRE
jgi:hypothetical protein